MGRLNKRNVIKNDIPFEILFHLNNSTCRHQIESENQSNNFVVIVFFGGIVY